MADSQFALNFSGWLPISAREGMKQAVDNADPQWLYIFDACVLAAARKKQFITSDDVLDEMESLPNPPSTHNLAAIGGLMMRAAGMGVIKASGRPPVRSTRPHKHGNRHSVWESCKYRGSVGAGGL